MSDLVKWKTYDSKTLLRIENEIHTVEYWSRQYKIDVNVVVKRINRGWNPYRALTKQGKLSKELKYDSI